MIRERNYEISEQEIKELNEMSVLIYRGMLAIMRSDRDKPTVDEAVDKTVRYLAKTLDAIIWDRVRYNLEGGISL